MKRRLMYILCAVFLLFAVLLTVACGKPPARRSGWSKNHAAAVVCGRDAGCAWMEETGAVSS